MGLGLVVHEREREVPMFKHGDCEGIITVHLMLEVGKWIYMNVSITAKIRQKNEEEELSIELDRKDLSLEVRDQDSLTKYKQELSEAIEAMKNVLYDYQNRMLKGIEFIDSYNF